MKNSKPKSKSTPPPDPPRSGRPGPNQPAQPNQTVRPGGMTSVSQAREFIMSRIVPIAGGDARVSLAESAGRILAEDVCAPFNVPGHDNSAMDGFACRVSDLSAGRESVLRIAGDAFAGSPFAGRFASGECVKIMTGAVLPNGSDIVIPKEETSPAGDGAVAIHPGARRAGANMRQAGEDLQAGAVALSRGTLLGASEVGLLGSLGFGDALVRRKLRVAHFSTGDELRSAGEVLGEGEIYDSNRRTIGALLSRLGAEAIDLGVVRDDRGALAAALDSAAGRADAIVTSGGASVGEADFIREILAERGEVLFWKVAMRPGRPLAYGKVGGKADGTGGVGGMGGVDFFGLPGNPVSVVVCFCAFVRDALFRRAGRVGDFGVPLFGVLAGEDLRKSPGRMEFQRGILRRAGGGGGGMGGVFDGRPGVGDFVVHDAGELLHRFGGGSGRSGERGTGFGAGV